MKNITKILLIVGIVLSGVSCNKFFDDMKPTDKVSDKVIWQTTANAEYYVNYLYDYVYVVVTDQASGGVMTEAYADMLKYSSFNPGHSGLFVSQMAYGQPYTERNFVNVYLGAWHRYTGIMKCNSAISDLHTYGQMSDEDKARLEGELRFTRAFMYFDLMKRYKDIILYDEDMTKYQKDKAISSEAEGWEFIYQDLLFAANNLPDRTASKGRADKGMAWAFMTRAMLYAQRYGDVLTAADEVAKLGYGLETNYEDALMKTTSEGNNEAILQWQFDMAASVTHSFDAYYSPGGDFAVQGQKGGGLGTPTQEMVESYEKKTTGGFIDWTPWHSTTKTNPPYDQLEPRFHATILYNGADWKGRKIQPYAGGIDGWKQWYNNTNPAGETTTGYYLRKMVDEGHDVVANAGGVAPFTIIRYAEVLLNKAEACYHLTDKVAEANDAVKAIRARVGLPYTPKGGSELWDAIRQERRVELAFEGHWYWDLRRWGVAHKQYPEGLTGYQVHGLKVTDNGDGSFTYEYVSVDNEDREFQERMYRLPMPDGELENNSLVEQYPEWK